MHAEFKIAAQQPSGSDSPWNCPTGSTGRRVLRGIRMYLLWLLLMGVMACGGLSPSSHCLLADQPAANDQTTVVDQPAANEVQRPATRPNDAATGTPDAESPVGIQKSNGDRERTITAGFYLLLLIVITGVSMLLLIVLGGSAVRRSARAPLPRQTPADPLWFLRDKPRLAERPTETGHESKTNSGNSGQQEPDRGEFDSDRPES